MEDLMVYNGDITISPITMKNGDVQSSRFIGTVVMDMFGGCKGI
jgi:hypothetical protein